MRFIIMALIFLLVTEVCSASDNTEQMEQRIQPVGKVHVAEQQNNRENVTPSEKESSGKKIYERYCVVCHRDGLVGAPKFRDEKNWSSRLSGRAIDELLVSVLNGLNAMPAKGTCYECNDEDIKSAVDYMLPKL
jgi:cytochrome c5